MRKAIIDYRTDIETSAELTRLGFDVIYTKPIKALYKEVCGHADMQVHVTDNKIICAPEVFNYYNNLIDGFDVIKGSIKLTDKYPYDIAYNTCRIGDYAICKKQNTAPEILAEYDNIINIKQGYAKCSLCVIGANSAITADNGLYKTLTENGIDVLKIRAGFISLYDMIGFIGGASGLIDKNILAFNGNIKTHPDYCNIRDFCRNYGTEIINLNNGILTDIGSIIAID